MKSTAGKYLLIASQTDAPCTGAQTRHTYNLRKKIMNEKAGEKFICVNARFCLFEVFVTFNSIAAYETI